MEVDGNGITGQMLLTELLSSFSIRVEIVEGLIPTSNQQKRFFMLTSNWAPLHAPNRRFKRDLILSSHIGYFLVEISHPKRKCAIDGSKCQSLSICAPTRRYDLLLEFLFRDFLASRDEEGEVCGTTAEQLMGEGIEGEG